MGAEVRRRFGGTGNIGMDYFGQGKDGVGTEK